MPTEKNAETPVSHLATALAAFQAALPAVTKGTAGQVRGNPNYKYADLADLNGTVLPKLAEFGLSFSCKPTLTEAGRFVMVYKLRHASGEEDSGEYPLPDNVSPQDMGSAQTYARRYILQAMTGVAPEGQDDDGAAATRAYSHRAPDARNGSQQRREQPADDTPAAPVQSSADRERAALAALAKEKGWDLGVIAAEYSKRYDGEDIRTADSGPRLKAFAKLLPDVMAPAANGAPA